MSCPMAVDDSTDEKGAKECYYNDYLQLNKLLDAQHRESVKANQPAHDEHLFIVTHQAYELWFKQILFELESCITLLSEDPVKETSLMTVVGRFGRITRIQQLLVTQMSVLETMTPLDFLDFRKFLSPASGFQSWQFRLLENRLGLRLQQRQQYNRQTYDKALAPEHVEIVKRFEEEPSLFDCLVKWLERCPFVEIRRASFGRRSPDPRVGRDYDFWASYKTSVQRMMDDESNSPEERASTQEVFDPILDDEKYDDLLRRGKVRLSHAAFKAALMIMLFRDEPLFQMPFTLLQHVMDVDSLLTQWRHAHASLVQRMLGSKVGTGGSSGYHYLRTAAANHRIFRDFFNMSTYMIPRAFLPTLPVDVQSNLQFRFASIEITEEADIVEVEDDSEETTSEFAGHANREIIRAFSQGVGW